MSTPAEEPETAEHWLDVVRDKVTAIRFGAIHITVHEGRVTQVEAIEKTRISSDRPDAPRKDRPARKKA